MKYLMLVIQSKKTEYDTKVSEIEKKVTDRDHDKYITTSEFNNLTAKSFAARLAQANLVRKTDFDTKLIRLKKFDSNETNIYLLKIHLKNYANI